MLVKNYQGDSSIELKFSRFIISKLAAAISPMTVGRRTANMLFTTGLSLKCVRAFTTKIMSRNDGSTTLNVARALPKIPMTGE